MIKIGIDTSIIIYQSGNVIGKQDGRSFVPLTNSAGEITSHLVGIYYRTIGMLENEKTIKPFFIFDGKKPKIKKSRVRSPRSFRMTRDIVESSKELVKLMGFPVIQSPYESDSQGSYMVKSGKLDYFATMDIDDAFAFGCTNCIKSKLHTTLINDERITLKNWLDRHELDNLDKYRDVFILIGNDYNDKLLPKGKGIKFALKAIREHQSIENVIKKYDFDIDIDIVNKTRKYLKFPKILKNHSLETTNPDYEGLVNFLVEENDFSIQKVIKYNDKLKRIHSQSGQRNIHDMLKKWRK